MFWGFILNQISHSILLCHIKVFPFELCVVLNSPCLTPPGTSVRQELSIRPAFAKDPLTLPWILDQQEPRDYEPQGLYDVSGNPFWLWRKGTSPSGHPQSQEPSSKFSWCPSDAENGITERAQRWLKASYQNTQKLTLPKWGAGLQEKPWQIYRLINLHLQTALYVHFKGCNVFFPSVSMTR